MNKEKNTRIAYFAGTMRPGHDGVTRVLYKLIEELNYQDISNIFFSPLIPTDDKQSTDMFKIPSIRFPLYKGYRIAMPGIRHFEQILNDFRPNLLHINSPFSLGYSAIKYAEKYKIPVVATYHTHFASYAKYYKIKTLGNMSWTYFKNLYNRCEKVYVPSKPILKELKNHGLKTIEYLPHGVDIKFFNPMYKSSIWKKSLGIEGKTVLLYSGRLVWEKDLKTLADTYNILSVYRDDFVFVLVGDGPIKNELQKLMPKASYQSGHALSTVYSSSDIFVFPSTTETFGNVTLEAMASGIPPVCARKGGASGIIIDGETGLLTKPGDALDLANKIEVLLDKPKLRNEIAKNALKYAQKQTWNKIFNKLFINYEQVITSYKNKLSNTNYSFLYKLYRY